MPSFYDILDEISMNPAAQKATENLKKAEDAQKKLMNLVSKNPNGVPTADTAMIAGEIDKNIGSATSNLTNSIEQMKQRHQQELEKLKKEKEGEEAATGQQNAQQGIGTQTTLKPKKQIPQKAPTPKKIGSALDSLRKDLTKK